MSSLYVIFIASLKIALNQLARHKVRSFLTLLGILIGVGAVVTIVSLGEGLKQFFNSSIGGAAAADMVYIMPKGHIEPGHINNQLKPFKNRDLAMVNGSEYVSSAFGGNAKEGTPIKHGWRTENVMLQNYDSQSFELDRMEIGRGRLYSRDEEASSALVCIVGSEIKDLVYEPGEEVLGSTLQINGLRFKVIGELKSTSALAGGSVKNRCVFVPLATGQHRIFGSDDLYWIAAKLNSSTRLQAAKEDLTQRLRASRNIRNGKDDDFSITTPDDWAKFANNFVNTLIGVFGVVAVIALLVGGIGVMNIMLVSVRERTREIGLRKAIGAKSSDIVWQFLVESMTLTLAGGIGGIAAGYGFGALVAFIMEQTLKVSWAPSVPLGWIIAVCLTCVGLGLLFGVYPAWRAGRLDPINALRYQ
jgi:putative ABC transport system permease protein